MFFCTIEPESTRDEAALEQVLAALQMEDPSFHVTVDESTGQRVLSGMGELHLEIIGDRIRRDHGLQVDISSVRVSYRETITTPVTHTCHYDGMVAGKRQSATLTVTVGMCC